MTACRSASSKMNNQPSSSTTCVPPEVVTTSSSAATKVQENQLLGEIHKTVKVLQQNVESLQEANVSTTAMLKHNERRINELQRTTEQMKEEKQANERLKRGTKYGRNNAMSVSASFFFDMIPN
ncbi:hypothetical protein G6F42_023021 [Rhizopus arrhizus]|nr:hypothetical protein G6F42_023021 [Rhizopus arrhizus]